MLVHVLLAGFPSGDQLRWQGLLAFPQVIVTRLTRKNDLHKSLTQKQSDIIVFHPSLLSKATDSLLALLRTKPDKPDVVVLTDREDAGQQAQLLAAGCLAVLNGSLADEMLKEALLALIHRRREQMQERLVQAGGLTSSRLEDFVSASPIMQTFISTVKRVVHADTPLLLCGETGVGKERLASAIHGESPRSQGPFVAINCGSLPEGLLESELFGHEEGAFTGAGRARRGHFELAHEGTIFLDEIGEMPLHLQVKLLRVLQERKIQRLGSETPFAINVRVMAATHRDLPAEIEAKRFRQDLYYRLAVVTLTIPPLRERKEDIPTLVNSYLQHYSGRLNREIRGISPEALQALVHYSWPGNVRELINVMERAVLLCSSEEITLVDLPATLSRIPLSENRVPCSPSLELNPFPANWLERPWREARKEALLSLEKAYLQELLRATKGHIGETAKRAGFNPRSLYEKMKQHGLNKGSFRKETN